MLIPICVGIVKLQWPMADRPQISTRKTCGGFSVERSRVRSDATCLVYLNRTPQFALPCGHSLCDICVRIFGGGGERETWNFRIHTCFLCGLKSDVTVKVKPDTAGVRMLSIDGGGVRGIMPRQILKLLEDRIGLPYPVQENFNGAFGISPGE